MESTYCRWNRPHWRLFSRVQSDPRPALAVCPINFGHLLAESVTGFPICLGGFDTLDTTPALASLGDELAHLLDGMMFTAVVAIGSFSSHGWLLPWLSPRRSRWNVARDAALDGFDWMAVTVLNHTAAGYLPAYRQVGEGSTYILQRNPGSGSDFGIQKLPVSLQVFEDLR